MDNRLNEMRKEMSVLRADMLRAECVIRYQVNHDQDCTQAALRLMAMRARMSALVREWTLLGGIAHLPTIEERLKGRRGSRPGARAVRLPSLDPSTEAGAARRSAAGPPRLEERRRKSEGGKAKMEKRRPSARA